MGFSSTPAAPLGYELVGMFFAVNPEAAGGHGKLKTVTFGQFFGMQVVIYSSKNLDGFKRFQTEHDDFSRFWPAPALCFPLNF